MPGRSSLVSGSDPLGGQMIVLVFTAAAVRPTWSNWPLTTGHRFCPLFNTRLPRYNAAMRVALGADHAGFQLKEAVKRYLASRGVSCEDFGTSSEAPVDYPDFAARVAQAVAAGRFDRGILVCGTGIGMAMAANKIAGIRAAPVHDLESARLGREHNNLNILTLAGRMTPADRACEIVRVFLDTPFAGDRHQRRINKIAALERPVEAASSSPSPPPARAGS